MLIVGYKLKYFLFYGINKEVNGILLEILTWEAVELTQTEFKLPKKAYSKVNFFNNKILNYDCQDQTGPHFRF